jgi:hypothetical protein
MTVVACLIDHGEGGVESIEAAKQELAVELNKVHEELRQEAIAFPAELRLTHPATDEWSAMELLGHIAEMHYSYVARARNLMAHPGAPLARDMQSPERIGAVERGPTLTVEQALEDLERARQYALAFLDELTPENMTIGGVHQALGPMTVRDVFSRTISGHARNHLNQLRETRAQLERR